MDVSDKKAQKVYTQLTDSHTALLEAGYVKCSAKECYNLTKIGKSMNNVIITRCWDCYEKAHAKYIQSEVTHAMKLDHELLKLRIEEDEKRRVNLSYVSKIRICTRKPCYKRFIVFYTRHNKESTACPLHYGIQRRKEEIRAEYRDQKKQKDKPDNVNTKIESYQRHAYEKGLKFDESNTETVIKMFYDSCYYCERSYNGINSNGIDRINNGKGYYINNVVSCCTTCNMMKNVLDFNTFIERIVHILSLYNFCKPMFFTDVFMDHISGSHRDYKKCAQKHKREFNLEPKDFLSIIKGNCYLCGKPNSGTHRNGIDRINNDYGYSVDNCASCCTSCNYLKGGNNLDTFFDKMLSIYNKFRNQIEEMIIQTHDERLESLKDRKLIFISSKDYESHKLSIEKINIIRKEKREKKTEIYTKNCSKKLKERSDNILNPTVCYLGILYPHLCALKSLGGTPFCKRHAYMTRYSKRMLVNLFKCSECGMPYTMNKDDVCHYCGYVNDYYNPHRDTKYAVSIVKKLCLFGSCTLSDFNGDYCKLHSIFHDNEFVIEKPNNICNNNIIDCANEITNKCSVLCDSCNNNDLISKLFNSAYIKQDEFVMCKHCELTKHELLFLDMNNKVTDSCLRCRLCGTCYDLDELTYEKLLSKRGNDKEIVNYHQTIKPRIIRQNYQNRMRGKSYSHSNVHLTNSDITNNGKTEKLQHKTYDQLVIESNKDKKQKLENDIDFKIYDISHLGCANSNNYGNSNGNNYGNNNGNNNGNNYGNNNGNNYGNNNGNNYRNSNNNNYGNSNSGNNNNNYNKYNNRYQNSDKNQNNQRNRINRNHNNNQNNDGYRNNGNNNKPHRNDITSYFNNI